MTVPLSHDAAQPLAQPFKSLSLANLSCPYLRAVWLRKKAGGFSCRSVLTWHTTFAPASCDFRAGDARAQNMTFALKNGSCHVRAGAARARCARYLCYLCAKTLTTSQPELELLRERISRRTLAGAMGAHFAHHFCTCKLRFRSRSFLKALHVLLYFKLANFQLLLLYLQCLWKCSSRTTLVLKTCDLSAGAAGARFPRYFCTYSLQPTEPRHFACCLCTYNSDFAAARLQMLFTYYFGT